MAELAVGQVVELKEGVIGTIRFLGQTHFATGDWVGVELEGGGGKNDGSVQGERYFECEMGRGMFVRPTIVVQVLEQPAPAAPVAPKPSNGPAVTKRVGRPASTVNSGSARRMSSVPDTGAPKRISVNAVSPSPVPRRPSSVLRSPTKSPTKQLGSGPTSSTSTPRTGTPSAGRPQSLNMPKARSTTPGTRTSMGPPPVPATRTVRSTPPGAPGGINRASNPPPKVVGGRPASSLAPKLNVRKVGDRIASIGSQISSNQSNDGGADEDNGDTLSPPGVSPTLSRGSPADRQHVSPASNRSAGSTSNMRSVSGGVGAAAREIEDLKTKLRLMEKKRLEDRDKLKALEQMQVERDKFKDIIEKLQAKYRPQQQEVADLRKELKETQDKLEELEKVQADHDDIVEMATLDREMAEETAEAVKTELEALKIRTEELELEVEVLREENAELGTDMSPEEKASQGWLQMQRSNERLKEALLRLRDITEQQEEELKDEIKSLQAELRELGGVKEEYEATKEKLTQATANIEDLRQQLDDALGAEDTIEELTHNNLTMQEQIEELKVTIEDLESLKELNDELEINHVETEKEMQEEIDIKDSIIGEQSRRMNQQEQAMEDMEYMLSRFRELVTNLQSDLEDMRASDAVSETESEQLNSRSRAMMDLNMKLQVSAAKTQIKTIDLELRRLEAQEASEHLAIVQLFLPEAYQEDRDSVLALLRFKRVGFKANLLHGFIKDRVNGQASEGHEDDVFAGCDAMDKLTWVSAMCDRFVNAISHCNIDEFAKYEGALYELEPVERALNSWIDGLRRDDLKEKQCADELQRTIALMTHLAEVHIPDNLASYADHVHMRTVVMQSHLENAAAAMSITKGLVQKIKAAEGDEEELAHHFSRKSGSVIDLTRSAKVIVGKAVRSLEEMRSRSLSLMPDTLQHFEQCEAATLELATYSRRVGEDIHTLLSEEGRTDPFTYQEVQSALYNTTLSVFTSTESDLFSTYLNKLRTLTNALVDLVALAADLEMTQEFERPLAPWVLRSQELKSSKVVPIDTEEEIRRLKEDNHERARLIAIRDKTLEEASVKIELLESRMRDAAKKNERIHELEKNIQDAKQREVELTEAVESQNKELTALEAEKEKWKKIAEQAKLIGETPGSKAGQERAVATAREMEALRTEINDLQSAVRYLREENRRARVTDSSNLSWLDEHLIKPKSKEEERKALVLAEGQDVLNELLNLTKTAELYDLSKMPKNKLGWRPAKTTPRYHVEKQKEGFEAWRSWEQSVIKKAHVLAEKDANRGIGRRNRSRLAKVELRLPQFEGKGVGYREVEIVSPESFEGFREGLGFV
ncbi:dynein associated protein-domain-containing protein [Xylogone sp. PMI_703]|nr:dynein associated protein-domain-containing protein [Xylogone sp. PMI_703]